MSVGLSAVWSEAMLVQVTHETMQTMMLGVEANS